METPESGGDGPGDEESAEVLAQPAPAQVAEAVPARAASAGVFAPTARRGTRGWSRRRRWLAAVSAMLLVAVVVVGAVLLAHWRAADSAETGKPAAAVTEFEAVGAARPVADSAAPALAAVGPGVRLS